MTTYTKENNITTCKFRINAFLIAKSIVNNIFKHSILNTRLQLALANFKRELKYVAYNYIIEKYKHLIVEEDVANIKYLMIVGKAKKDEEDSNDDELGKSIAYYRAKIKRMSIEQDAVQFINDYILIELVRSTTKRFSHINMQILFDSEKLAGYISNKKD